MVQRREAHGDCAEDEGLLRVVRGASVRELLRVLARGRMDAGGLAILPRKPQRGPGHPGGTNLTKKKNALSTFRRGASVDIEKT